MADWVKIDPIALGERLSPLQSMKARGEGVSGFQWGIGGGLPRIGATPAEKDGHAYGISRREQAKQDKAEESARKRVAAEARWGKQGKSRSDAAAYPPDDADAMLGEEKRGEENFPKGGNGASAPPPDGTPDWKLNKAEAYRREIADHRLVVDRLEAIPADKLRPDARAKLEQTRADIRALETKIFGFGLKP